MTITVPSPRSPVLGRGRGMGCRTRSHQEHGGHCPAAGGQGTGLGTAGKCGHQRWTPFQNSPGARWFQTSQTPAVRSSEGRPTSPSRPVLNSCPPGPRRATGPGTQGQGRGASGAARATSEVLFDCVLHKGVAVFSNFVCLRNAGWGRQDPATCSLHAGSRNWGGDTLSQQPWRTLSPIPTLRARAWLASHSLKTHGVSTAELGGLTGFRPTGSLAQRPHTQVIPKAGGL